MKNMTSFPWQVLQINNILVTFSLLSIYRSKFLTWQFFLVKEKLARQIFLDKENLSTIPHLHEQFFLVKENLSRKNCSCKWGLREKKKSSQFWRLKIFRNFFWSENILQLKFPVRLHDLRACSHGGGGPRVGEVPRLGGVTNLSIQFLFYFLTVFTREVGYLNEAGCSVSRAG